MAPLYPPAGSGSGMAIGGTVTSGTTGSVLFIGPGPVLAQDNANLFFDDTNNRLGIGTASPGYNVASQQIPTATSGTIAAISGLVVTNPSGASTAAYLGFFAQVESFSGNAQNHLTYMTGSGYSVIHRGTGTMNDMRGVTLTVQNDAGAGATTQVEGVKAQTSFAASINQLHGFEWTPVITATGTVTTNRAFVAGAPGITAGGTLTSSTGLYVSNQGGTGVSRVFGAWIEPQTGASSTNIGILAGTTTIPVGALATGFFVSPSAAAIDLVLRGASAQTGDLIQTRDSVDTVLGYTTSGGQDIGPQSPATVSVLTDKYMLTAGNIKLTGAQAITLAGTAHWAHMGAP